MAWGSREGTGTAKASAERSASGPMSPVMDNPWLCHIFYRHCEQVTQQNMVKCQKTLEKQQCLSICLFIFLGKTAIWGPSVSPLSHLILHFPEVQSACQSNRSQCQMRPGGFHRAINVAQKKKGKMELTTGKITCNVISYKIKDKCQWSEKKIKGLLSSIPTTYTRKCFKSLIICITETSVKPIKHIASIQFFNRVYYFLLPSQLTPNVIKQQILLLVVPCQNILNQLSSCLILYYFHRG